MSNAIQPTNQPDFVSASQISKKPDMATLVQWVSEVIGQFRREWDNGFQFSAWSVSQALINTYGAQGWFIPHNEQRHGEASIQAIVHKLMRGDGLTAGLMDDPVQPYDCVEPLS